MLRVSTLTSLPRFHCHSAIQLNSPHRQLKLGLAFYSSSGPKDPMAMQLQLKVIPAKTLFLRSNSLAESFGLY